MSFMGGGAPKPPETPPPPKVTDPKIQDQKDRWRRMRAARSATNVTGGQGVTTPAPVLKQRLGE